MSGGGTYLGSSGGLFALGAARLFTLELELPALDLRWRELPSRFALGSLLVLLERLGLALFPAALDGRELFGGARVDAILLDLGELALEALAIQLPLHELFGLLPRLER